MADVENPTGKPDVGNFTVGNRSSFEPNAVGANLVQPSLSTLHQDEKSLLLVAATRQERDTYGNIVVSSESNGVDDLLTDDDYDEIVVDEDFEEIEYEDESDVEYIEEELSDEEPDDEESYTEITYNSDGDDADFVLNGQGNASLRQYKNAATRAAEEEASRKEAEEDEARRERARILVRQKEMERKEQEETRKRETQALEAARVAEEKEIRRREEEERAARIRAEEAAAIIAEEREENRMRLLELEELRKAEEAEARGIAAKMAAEKREEQERMRRLEAEEALAKAAAEKLKMEKEIREMETRLEAAKQAKEEAKKREEEERGRLAAKVEARRRSAEKKLEKLNTEVQSEQPVKGAGFEIKQDNEPLELGGGPVPSVEQGKTTIGAVEDKIDTTVNLASSALDEVSTKKKKVFRKVVRRVVRNKNGEILSSRIERVEDTPTGTSGLSNTSTIETLPNESSHAKEPAQKATQSTIPVSRPLAPSPAHEPAPELTLSAENAGEHYTVIQLQKQLVPGLDYKNREKYLSLSDFQAIFGCNKDEFASWPKWKQTNLKRKAKLF